MCFFFNDTATTEIYTLSLHDALPILLRVGRLGAFDFNSRFYADDDLMVGAADPFQLFRIMHEIVRNGALAPDSGVNFMLEDRKSTRLNSSHANISYAVFCLKKKPAYFNICIYLTTIIHLLSTYSYKKFTHCSNHSLLFYNLNHHVLILYPVLFLYKLYPLTV